MFRIFIKIIGVVYQVKHQMMFENRPQICGSNVKSKDETIIALSSLLKWLHFVLYELLVYFVYGSTIIL